MILPAPIIAPFQGLRYGKKVTDLSRVMAPPYDVISTELQSKLYARDPYNVVRLILGQQSASDSETDNRYTRAQRDLQAWKHDGILETDLEPSYYLYEQQFRLKDGREFKRRGFLALRRLESFQGGKVRPHEKTLSGPKADRLLLTKACQANLSPIFALYADREGLMKANLQPHFAKTPLVDIRDDEGVQNRLWRVSDPDLFRKTDEAMRDKTLFIADGHHRYETAMTYRNWMEEKNGPIPEDSPLNYVMMFFSEMSDPGLAILPTHRILRNQPGFDASVFRKQLEKLFQFKDIGSDQPGLIRSLEEAGTSGPAFGLVLAGDKNYYVMSLKDAMGSSHIDTSILHNHVFHDLKYLHFVKEANEVFDAAGEADFNCGFLLNAPKMEILRQVVEAGEILPPKTTYFYPKLLSGLVLRQIDPKGRVTI